MHMHIFNDTAAWFQFILLSLTLVAEWSWKSGEGCFYRNGSTAAQRPQLEGDLLRTSEHQLCSTQTVDSIFSSTPRAPTDPC